MDGGFAGFIDFVGYPVSQGVAKPGGRGARVGGKKHGINMLILADQAREEASIIALMAHVALKKRITQMWEENERQRQEMLWGNALATIVAEV